MATYDNKVLKGDQLYYLIHSLIKPALAGKQATINNDNKLPYSYLSGTPTIPDVSNLQPKITSTNKLSYSLISGTPTKVSDFSNDSNFQNASQVSASISAAISGLTGFHFIKVDTLPATGDVNAIYLVPKTSSSTGNVYTEYAYINSAWEVLGDTEINLEYITNAEIDTMWNA